MKKRSILLSLVISLFLISYVSAGIYFSNPELYYNLGDVIEVGVEVDPILEGFLKIDLVCDGGTINVFNGMPNEAGKVNITFPLTFSYIKENSGACYFFAEYLELTGKSRDFEISKALEIRLDNDNLFVNPGEEFILSGMATRLSGVGINGEVEITIPLLSLKIPEVVEEVNETGEETCEDVECLEICEEELNDCNEICGEIDECNEACEEGNNNCVDNCEEDCVNEGEEEETEEEDEEEIEETEEEDEEEIEETIIVDNGLFYGKIVDGIFSVNIVLAEDTPAGDYRVDVKAFEKDSSDKITSENIIMANLEVLQILTSIDIALNTAEIDPGENLNFKPILLDQAGNEIKDEISIIIKDEESNRIFERILQSGETFEYLVPSNLISGYYDIEASSMELNLIKKFYVNEKAIVSFELRNSSLIVTNIGNIPYKKDVQVDLNGRSFVKKVNLGLGEQQEFKLTGEGDYEIKITDGNSEEIYSGVALTGNAINVEAVKKGFVALNTPIVWIFFIIILGAGILFLFRNILKKKSFAYPVSGIKEKLSKLKLKKKQKGVDKIEQKKEKPIEKAKSIETINQAEQALVLKGHKTRAVVLCLKIKSKLSKQGKIGLNKIIQHVYSKKGVIYERGEYVLIIFSPLMTKTYHNEVIAAKVAELIQLEITTYNKKFSEKINLGIAINSGEIVNKIENKKLKFTALGNLVPSVKRIAEISKGEVLMTKQSHEKSGNAIKTTKKGEVYEIRKVLDIEKNKEFIDNFLKRVGVEKNKKGATGFSL
jgi:hypothetical protein